MKEVANNALTAAATNTAAIAGLENTVNDIPATNTALLNKVDALEKKLAEVEANLDDVRNRSMRGNLVIHRIQESEKNDNDPQTKVTTRDLVANFLVTHLDAPSQAAAKAQIVRAHRSAKNSNRQRNTPTQTDLH